MSPLRWLKRWALDPELPRQKAFLGGLELFSGLNGREIGRLAGALHSRTYRPGEVVFVEGDIGRALFILESGKVELTRGGPDGAPVHLYTLNPGEFFGEMALLESLPRTATATAVEVSRLHLLHRTKLDALVHAEPRLGAAVMSHIARLLSSRLRNALSNGAAREA